MKPIGLTPWVSVSWSLCDAMFLMMYSRTVINRIIILWNGEEGAIANHRFAEES
jgi:hypothetical protein